METDLPTGTYYRYKHRGAWEYGQAVVEGVYLCNRVVSAADIPEGAVVHNAVWKKGEGGQERLESRGTFVKKTPGTKGGPTEDSSKRWLHDPTEPTPTPPKDTLGHCAICGFPNVSATIHDFKYDGVSTPFDYKVCANHLMMLAMLRLPKADVLKLRALAGCDVFYSHDDFYDEEGNAIQPR